MLVAFRKSGEFSRCLRSMVFFVNFSISINISLGIKPKKLSFLQLCCAFFEKSFDDLNNIPEDELKKLALEQADKISKSKEAEEIEAALAARREKEEAEARARAEQLEKESQLTGVAAKQAFFMRQQMLAPTESNADKIKKEAALRRALKEVKKKEEEELAALQEEIIKGISPDKAKEKLRLAMEKKLADEAAEKARLDEEEAKAREERRKSHNYKWSSTTGSPRKP